MPEVLVVIVVLIILAAMFLPVLAHAKRRHSRIDCVSNLKQVDLSFLIWAGDHNNKYPMQLSVTNDGAKEWIATNNVTDCLRLMSNELCTPKILICPEDKVHTFAATNFENDFNASRISYFIGVDADTNYPQLFLSGDDNFTVGGVPAKSSLLPLPTNSFLAWGPGRHGDVSSFFRKASPRDFFGNVSFADGSVTIVSSLGLQNAFESSTYGTGITTNRLAIP